MNLKHFAKPTISKIVITIILGIGSSFYSMYETLFDVGYPFIFYDTSFVIPGLGGHKHDLMFKIHYLLLDVLIWFFVSCLLIYIISIIFKHRKKSK